MWWRCREEGELEGAMEEGPGWWCGWAVSDRAPMADDCTEGRRLTCSAAAMARSPSLISRLPRRPGCAAGTTRPVLMRVVWEMWACARTALALAALAREKGWSLCTVQTTRTTSVSACETKVCVSMVDVGG